ncbi:hypothetical protein TIFTF001_013647 [Ficus carica]|uniref:Uncharacterized protein n=1 Tax=Ficus carica TaxID=3494 RepID=A0AA88D349_FICCA|nr:hypothetical protein TIFTF001_013647 [Ficus carica]
MEITIDCHRHRSRRRRRLPKVVAESVSDQEVSSVEWEFISMTEQEEDIIRRMFRLVGERRVIN